MNDTIKDTASNDDVADDEKKSNLSHRFEFDEEEEEYGARKQRKGKRPLKKFKRDSLDY